MLRQDEEVIKQVGCLYHDEPWHPCMLYEISGQRPRVRKHVICRVSQCNSKINAVAPGAQPPAPCGTRGRPVSGTSKPVAPGRPILHYPRAQAVWVGKAGSGLQVVWPGESGGQYSAQAGASGVVVLATTSLAARSGTKHGVASCTHQ
jgi:hypothetical protein